MSDLRRVLHSAIAYVRSQEETKAVSSITLDHVIDIQIRRLQSSSDTQTDRQGFSARKSRFDRLDDLEKQLDAVSQALENAGNDPEKLAQLGLAEETT